MSKSWHDVLKVHPAAELLPLMPREELETLGDDIELNGLTSPIVIWSERGQIDEPHYLLDGRNRLDAMELVGIPVLNEEGNLCVPDLHEIEGGDPYTYFFSANLRRRHLNGEQKRELIANLLKARPDSSNRQIAALLGVDDKTVGAVREKLEARAEFPHVETRRDSKGRQQQARKPLPIARNNGHRRREPVVSELTSLSWSEASPVVQRKFVESVGLRKLFKAAEPDLQRVFFDELTAFDSATAYVAAHPGR